VHSVPLGIAAVFVGMLLLTAGPLSRLPGKLYYFALCCGEYSGAVAGDATQRFPRQD